LPEQLPLLESLAKKVSLALEVEHLTAAGNLTELQYRLSKRESCDGFCICGDHRAVFCSVRILRRLPVGGMEMIENWIVGAIAVALIIYLFLALLRPDRF
jgi:K+-transporting ATPase KdpF subunit